MSEDADRPSAAGEPDPGNRPDFMGPEAPVAEHARRRGFPRPGGSRFRVGLAIAGAFVVGIGLGVLGTLLLAGEDETGPAQAAAGPQGGGTASEITLPQVGADDPDAYGTVAVSGQPLPVLTNQGDPTIGLPAPELQGADFLGNPVAITNDGQAKIVLFLAHWCPYCRDEVPIVRDWFAQTDLPEDVTVYSVATLTDITRTNYPPRTWLESESWNVPVIVDDARDTAAAAFGVNAVPFWVLIDADGRVVFRSAGGGVPADALTGIAEQLSAETAPAGTGE